MTQILMVDANVLVQRVADELKSQKLVAPPDWSKFVKTGHHRERLPDNPEWWYLRASAVLRGVAKLGPIGTQKLRTKYGGRKNRGHKPEHVYQASGSIIRTILQQLEKAKLIKQTQVGVHKGRVLTPAGTAFLDKIAVGLSNAQ